MLLFALGFLCATILFISRNMRAKRREMGGQQGFASNATDEKSKVLDLRALSPDVALRHKIDQLSDEILVAARRSHL